MLTAGGVDCAPPPRESPERDGGRRGVVHGAVQPHPRGHVPRGRHRLQGLQGERARLGHRHHRYAAHT